MVEQPVSSIAPHAHHLKQPSPPVKSKGNVLVRVFRHAGQGGDRMFPCMKHVLLAQLGVPQHHPGGGSLDEPSPLLFVLHNCSASTPTLQIIRPHRALDSFRFDTIDLPRSGCGTHPGIMTPRAVGEASANPAKPCVDFPRFPRKPRVFATLALRDFYAVA